jgi:hypothetical protein
LAPWKNKVVSAASDSSIKAEHLPHLTQNFSVENFSVGHDRLSYSLTLPFSLDTFFKTGRNRDFNRNARAHAHTHTSTQARHRWDRQ